MERAPDDPRKDRIVRQASDGLCRAQELIPYGRSRFLPPAYFIPERPGFVHVFLPGPQSFLPAEGILILRNVGFRHTAGLLSVS